MEKLPIYFAPLQGYTEAAYRNIHQNVFGGVEAYYTPFVRLEKGKLRKKDIRDIEPDNNEVSRLIPQFIAAKPDEARYLIDQIAERGYQEIDFNMGCPFPMMTKRHKGAGILPFTDEVEAIIKVLEEYKELTFTAKLRLGQENAEDLERLTPMLNESLFKHITIHPRLGKNAYKGELDMEAFDKAYQEIQKPIIFNGEIHSLEDIETITKKYPNLAGLMIGRGLLERPSLAFEYQEGAISDDELLDKAREMHQALYNYYEEKLEGGDKQMLMKMQNVWDYLLPDLDKKKRKKIVKAGSLRNYLRAIAEL